MCRVHSTLAILKVCFFSLIDMLYNITIIAVLYIEHSRLDFEIEISFISM